MKRLSKNYKSFKHDLERLQEELLSNPAAGTDLGGGVHKVRMAIAGKNRGKSHGARVITYVYERWMKSGVSLPCWPSMTRLNASLCLLPA